MSEIHEELLGRGLNTKRIIGVIIIAGLLIGVFVFQTTIFSVIFGTEKQDANEELRLAPPEDPELYLIPPPLSLEDLLSLLSPDQLATLMDMLDGNIADLDMSDYAALLAALLFSEVEVFRIYNYDNFNSMSDVLWKYEAFDQYDGNSWSSSASPALSTFADYATYYGIHQPAGADLLRLQRVLNPSVVGTNSFVAGTIFSDPLIMDSSIQSVNTSTLNEAASVLYVDDFNCSVLELTFTSTDPAKIEYELYGIPGLPDSTTINSSAVDESFTPASIQSQYLQLPPTLAGYRENNDDFEAKYLELTNIIQPTDNAFTIAYKIRNYLQDPNNFTGGLAGAQIYQTDGPSEGEDEIEWFCEKEGGLWIHFAAAYTAFCRSFGVAARFVDGFNSRNIEEENDGDNFFKIKYKNMYNWAEVYIPTNIDGTGYWVQMDVQYGEGLNPIAEGDFDIEVIVDNATNDINRDDYVKLTATLTSSDSSVESRQILFKDYISDMDLGQAYTDVNGNASIYVQLDNTHTAGSHLAIATFQSTYNYTTYDLIDDVTIVLQPLFNSVINRSIGNSTTIQGYIYDDNHVSDAVIQNATLNFVLLQKGSTNRVPALPFTAFTPETSTVITDVDGQFNLDIILGAESLVPIGEYDLRVDFNGTTNFAPQEELVNGSSNIRVLNVTKFQAKTLGFYINNYPSDVYDNPVVGRSNPLYLKAIVFNETGGPVVGENVTFYDYTQGNIIIGSNTTDLNGNATYTYNTNYNSRLAGPNLLYASIGTEINYSYYIVNEVANVTITSGPDPLIINRTAPGDLEFNIAGFVSGNSAGDRLKYANVELLLYRFGYDNSSRLDPNPVPLNTGSDGSFDFTYEVDDDTPQGNYTLIVNFTGEVNLGGYPLGHYFDLLYISSSNTSSDELRVLASDIFIFNFWINDTTSDDLNNPVLNRNDWYELKAYLQGGTDPLIGEKVDFYDLTENKSLGSAFTDGFGYAIYTLPANTSLSSGPHLIRATYDVTNINYSYYILDAPIQVAVNNGPIPTSVNKSGTEGRTFYIEGLVKDSEGNPIPYARVSVRLFGPGMVDRTSFLLPQGGAEQIYNYYYCNETGMFNASYNVHSSIPAENHTIRVYFNGTFIYGQPFPHTFNLIGFSNFSTFSNGLNNLTVIDPDLIEINIKINDTYLSSTFNDGNPPITVKRGQLVNISFEVSHAGGDPIAGDQIIVNDMFANINISNYIFTGIEFGLFNLSIPTLGNHSGLHKWEFIFKDAAQIVYETTNSTYILINETATVDASIDVQTISRGIDGWSISGNITDSDQDLKALEITLFLLDSGFQDKSIYLNVPGGKTKVINIDGTFFFSGTISLNAPQGIYYFKINTTAGVQSTDAPLALSMVNAGTVNSSSPNIQVNITARTNIIEDSYWTSLDESYPEYTNKWINGSTLYVNGTLEWLDNGTALQGMIVTVTVELLDSTVIATNVSLVTDIFGYFEVTLLIDETFPLYRADTRIFVDFQPYNNNNIDYTEASQEEYTI